MTDVLHVQTRAYPLHYGTLDSAVASLSVPGRAELPLFAGALDSQAYNPDATVEADLTGLVRAEVALPGTEIVRCRARLLAAGTVLLTYALRHEADLRELDTIRVDEFDARINRELRKADHSVVGAVLDAAADAGLLSDLTVIKSDGIGHGRPSAVDLRTVRYNCHFITRDPPWESDRRLPSLALGPNCRILMTYTYTWDADPDTPFDEILTMLEPTDLAVAQMSVLFGAMIGGRRILAEVARAAPGRVNTHEFRRFLDRVWSEYHRLDSYRMESGQAHRATYLAARETIALDPAHQRAGELLDYVSNSLQAESSMRSQQLDARLNRVAAALTVVVGGSFAVDIAAFLVPDVHWGVRLAIVMGVLVLSLAALGATIRSVAAARRGASARLQASPQVPPPRQAGPAGSATTRPRTADVEEGPPSEVPVDDLR